MSITRLNPTLLDNLFDLSSLPSIAKSIFGKKIITESMFVVILITLCETQEGISLFIILVSVFTIISGMTCSQEWLVCIRSLLTSFMKL